MLSFEHILKVKGASGRYENYQARRRQSVEKTNNNYLLWAFSHLRTCRSPPHSKVVPFNKWLWMVRSVLNKTGKIIKKILRHLFFELSSKIGVIFSQKNDTKMTITRKINIRKIWKLVFLCIQPISMPISM